MNSSQLLDLTDLSKHTAGMLHQTLAVPRPSPKYTSSYKGSVLLSTRSLIDCLDVGLYSAKGELNFKPGFRTVIWRLNLVYGQVHKRLSP